jgi:hypothetical protein
VTDLFEVDRSQGLAIVASRARQAMALECGVAMVAIVVGTFWAITIYLLDNPQSICFRSPFGAIAPGTGKGNNRSL